MSEVFVPGEKVIAYYEAGHWLRGWYSATILRADHDGGYLVSWEAARADTGLRPASSVDTVMIRRRSERGPYSAGF
jgi:hypothetical protein